MEKQENKIYLSPGDSVLNDLAATYFPNAKTVLDLGCGSGANMGMFLNNGMQCTGVTISQKEFSMASRIAETYLYNLEDGIPSTCLKNYDLVIAAHLLEHIFYPDKLLTDLMAVMGMGAIIVIPNLLYWRNRAKLLFGIWQYQELGIMDYTHCRWYSLKGIQKLIENHGFGVIRCHATGDFIPGKSQLVKLVNSALVKLRPGLFGFQFYLVISPRERRET